MVDAEGGGEVTRELDDDELEEDDEAEVVFDRDGEIELGADESSKYGR